MAQTVKKIGMKRSGVSASRAKPSRARTTKAEREEAARIVAAQDAELERMLRLIDSKLDDIDQCLQGIIDRRAYATS
jgi:hypothetical protein